MTKINDIVESIDDVTARFDTQVDRAQARLLNEVLAMTKDLNTKNGQIMPTVDNLRTINTIRNKIAKVIVNKDYMKGVNDLLKSFQKIQAQQVDYFSGVFDAKKLSSKYEITLQMSIDNTAQALTESGINANVADGLKKMLVRSVVSGGMYKDLVGSMREYLTDTEKSSGALTRYAKTYAATSLSQFTGETNKLLTQDYSPKWFRYVGSNKETTREWCEHMTEKEWVHESEFQTIISGDVDGKKVEIYEKTELPRGMIDGTKPDNLLVNRGGWGCQHQFYAVDERIVPDSAKDKLKNKTKKDIVVSEEEAMDIIKKAELNGEEVLYRGDIRDKGLEFLDDLTDYKLDGRVKNQGGFNFFTDKKSYAHEYAKSAMNEEIRAKPTNPNITAISIKKDAKIFDFRKLTPKKAAEFELELDKYKPGHLDDYRKNLMKDVLDLDNKALFKKYKSLFNFELKNGVYVRNLMNHPQTYSDFELGKAFKKYLQENGYDGYVFKEYQMGSEYGIINKDVFQPIAKYFIK